MSKRVLTCSGVIQRTNGISSASGASSTDASSWSSRIAGGRGLAAVLVLVDGAAREDPGPAHEALLGVALDQQDLRPVG